jgi:2-oxoglutarate ferredoxin oxidoreductase subunit gamma
MQNDVIMAGFGGQGVMLIGKILAYAGMNEGKEVSWLPSYGPEMRGGTANCTVVVSDRPVGSPLVYHPQAVVAMNLPSLDKFEPLVEAGGILVVNTSLVPREAVRHDVDLIKLPATDIALALDNPRAANMVALGAYIGATGVVSIEAVAGVVRETFAGRPKVVDANLKALRRGYEFGKANVRKREAA